jgi:hypothetical protein
LAAALATSPSLDALHSTTRTFGFERGGSGGGRSLA